MGVRAKPGLNAPTGAWCSLTSALQTQEAWGALSQCTYRCVVLPDNEVDDNNFDTIIKSQCTYRCVVLPDRSLTITSTGSWRVSMHLQVRGAP